MADLEQRLYKDTLIIAEPVADAALRFGVESPHDLAFLNLIEQDSLSEIMGSMALTQAACLASNTSFCTAHKLRQLKLEDAQASLIDAAIQACVQTKCQHILFELTPAGLPLDPDNASSLTATMVEYQQPLKLVDGKIDAVLMSGFDRIDDARCALMALRSFSDTLALLSFEVDTQGFLGTRNKEHITEAAACAQDLGASVIGVKTSASPADIGCLLRDLRLVTHLPLLLDIQLEGAGHKRRWQPASAQFASPETLIEFVVPWLKFGLGFIRFSGRGALSFTAALAHTIQGLAYVDQDV